LKSCQQIILDFRDHVSCPRHSFCEFSVTYIPGEEQFLAGREFDLPLGCLCEVCEEESAAAAAAVTERRGRDDALPE
jgi:hypothetical protein